MNQNPWALTNGQLTLYCHVQPGAKQSQLVGLYNQRLKIQLKATPVDGKANQALTAYLAKLFNCPRSAISLKNGTNQRRKTLLIEGIDELPEVLKNLNR